MRKNYKYIVVLSCAILILGLLTGCAGQTGRELTEEQEGRIDKIIQNLDTWEAYNDFVGTYPANRLHISEIETEAYGIVTILTVGHVQEGTGMMEGSEIFVAKGYAVTADFFTGIDSVHQDWISDCITIDVETMLEEELREAIRESYIAFLEKE